MTVGPVELGPVALEFARCSARQSVSALSPALGFSGSLLSCGLPAGSKSHKVLVKRNLS